MGFSFRDVGFRSVLLFIVDFFLGVFLGFLSFSVFYINGKRVIIIVLVLRNYW